MADQDYIAGFDPTGLTSISGANLLALVNAAVPFTDMGQVKTTTDVAGVPQVPDAVGVTKYQRYFWRRVTASSVVVYTWNPAASSDVTFLKWQSITISSIPDGSITTDKIVNGAVTDDKITSMSYGKLTGVPSGSAPSGAAGGDLTGTYPNPAIATNAVNSTKLASDGSVDANRAVGTNHIKDQAITFAKFDRSASSALQVFRINSGGTLVETVTKRIVNLAEPTGAEALKLPRVNSAASAYEHVYPVVMQSVSKKATSDSTAVVLPYDTSIPQNTEGKEFISLAFTPLLSTSQIRIRFTCFGVSTVGNLVIALFSNASANALFATTAYDNTADKAQSIGFEFLYASPGTSAITFSVRFGPGSAGTARLNSDSTGTIFGAAAMSFLTIEEIVGTLS